MWIPGQDNLYNWESGTGTLLTLEFFVNGVLSPKQVSHGMWAWKTIVDMARVPFSEGIRTAAGTYTDMFYHKTLKINYHFKSHMNWN